ncbi:MAG: hypothetical protein GYA61_05480 [Spirochaetales bacterium]|nr:hypothetical protein [Spirochaetales bacterium]
MKTLVTFYSRTGLTEKIANEIAKKLSCDIEQIKDLKNRKGFWGFMISGYEAVSQKLSKIAKTEKNPGEYDLVVLLSPVWASSLSSPIRTYLFENGKKMNKVAFVATCGDNPGKIFDQMKQLTTEPLCTFSIKESEIKSGNYYDKLDQFIEKLR